MSRLPSPFMIRQQGASLYESIVVTHGGLDGKLALNLAANASAFSSNTGRTHTLFLNPDVDLIGALNPLVPPTVDPAARLAGGVTNGASGFTQVLLPPAKGIPTGPRPYMGG